jgi:glyoxylase-like metal-dependent hydrolase (beta-lactamase superfamily II)
MRFEAEVAPGVHRVEDAYTNWYLIEDDNGRNLTVVDAGVPTSWHSLQTALERLDRSPSDVAAVVLTHAHFDHVGFAEKARSELGVPVMVHDDDVPLTRNPMGYAHERGRAWYLTNRDALPIMASMLRNRAFWPPPIADVQRLTTGSLDVPGAPRVVFSPGHTYGHCALHLPDRDTLIAGDAIVTLDPYTGRRGPQIVARAATAYSDRALASLDALEATGASTVLTGHGEPWRDGIAEACRRARTAGVS